MSTGLQLLLLAALVASGSAVRNREHEIFEHDFGADGAEQAEDAAESQMSHASESEDSASAGSVCSITERTSSKVTYGVRFGFKLKECDYAKCSKHRFFTRLLRREIEARQLAATCNCVQTTPKDGGGERILFSFRSTMKYCTFTHCWGKLSSMLFLIKQRAMKADKKKALVFVDDAMESTQHWDARCGDGPTGSTVPDLSTAVAEMGKVGAEIEAKIRDSMKVIVPQLADIAVKDEEEVYDPEVFQDAIIIPAVETTTTEAPETTTTSGAAIVNPVVELATTTSTTAPAVQGAEEHVSKVELLIEEGKTCSDFVHNGKPCRPIKSAELCQEAAAFVTSTSGARYHTFLDPTPQYAGGCVLRSTLDKVAHVWWNGIDNPMPARKMARGALGWVPICSCDKA